MATPAEHYRLNLPRISGVGLARKFTRRTSVAKVLKLVRRLSGVTGGVQKKNSQSISRDWAKILSKTSESFNTQLMELERAIVQLERPMEHFCTGSCYTGGWNDFGMSGSGVYKYYYGVQYDGEMEDGMFHGSGTLTYPTGHKMQGMWDKGKLVSFKYIFNDGLMYTQSGNYCKYPDRRFYSSLKDKAELLPAPNERLTNKQPTPKIPKNCYDVIDGFYNPITRCVFAPIAKTFYDHEDIVDDKELHFPLRGSSSDSIIDSSSSSTSNNRQEDVDIDYLVISVPQRKEAKWIKANCRKAWDEPTGYRPALYEHWTAGRAAEIEAILAEIEESGDGEADGSIITDLKHMLALRRIHESLDTKRFFDMVDDLLSDVLNVNNIKMKL